MITKDEYLKQLNGPVEKVALEEVKSYEQPSLIA